MIWGFIGIIILTLLGVVMFDRIGKMERKKRDQNF